LVSAARQTMRRAIVVSFQRRNPVYLRRNVWHVFGVICGYSRSSSSVSPCRFQGLTRRANSRASARSRSGARLLGKLSPGGLQWWLAATLAVTIQRAGVKPITIWSWTRTARAVSPVAAYGRWHRQAGSMNWRGCWPGWTAPTPGVRMRKNCSRPPNRIKGIPPNYHDDQFQAMRIRNSPGVALPVLTVDLSPSAP
jgi:hypothetical protein